MSAGGTNIPQGGPGGQAAYRPVTPFSQGALGMQGSNTGAPPPGLMMSQGLGGLPSAPGMALPDMARQQQPMGQMNQMGNLSQLASVIRSVGAQPMSGQPLVQAQQYMPQAPYPNQNVQMPQQAPAMQQGLGGLGAYIGGGQ